MSVTPISADFICAQEYLEIESAFTYRYRPHVHTLISNPPEITAYILSCARAFHHA